MPDIKKIQSALISVFYKDGLEQTVRLLNQHNIPIYSTGGTRSFIEGLGVSVQAVEDLTGYPSILGGRVKTLHPNVFGGILARRENNQDLTELNTYQIPEIDLVIVDLYPFEETLNKGGNHDEIIEKIDIGGVSLIRAAAKNFEDVTIISNKNQFGILNEVLEKNNAETTLLIRKKLAAEAFVLTSSYDNLIGNWMSEADVAETNKTPLRYGENPHQKAYFQGHLNDAFEKLSGKELSYNNLLDIDAAVQLINEFSEPSFAIIKHNNACGIASRSTLFEAWTAALACDPVSAFGGILIANRSIDAQTAQSIHPLFFEVLLAPGYDNAAIEILTHNKPNRILLRLKPFSFPNEHVRTALNGLLVQDRNAAETNIHSFKTVTKKSPSSSEMEDLVFANKIVKHTKSNCIVLCKAKTLLASGTGQTSRVDALKQAIEKAKHFSFDLKDGVMASDAFFPFPDCVELAEKAGITAVVQPGGSVKDGLSIEYCDQHSMAMVFTGVRHFKH